MNFRLLGFLTLSFSLASVQTILASEAPASAAAVELGKCPICLEDMTPKELAGGQLVSGKELFGCSENHLFHRNCIIKPDGSLIWDSCPICRTTKVSLDSQRAGLMAYYSAYFRLTPEHAAPIPAPLPPLQIARQALATAPVPAGVRAEIWHSVQLQLRASNDLTLDSRQLTTAELSAIIDALPQHIRTSITRLDISHNQLTALPDTIGQLTALQRLVVSSNQLTKLPDTIGQLTALQELDVSRNQLTTLPYTIGNLTALQILSVSFNQLTKLPDTIRQLTALQTIWVNRTVRIPALRPEVRIRRIERYGTV